MLFIFSEGSIGGDIICVFINDLVNFYGDVFIGVLDNEEFVLDYFLVLMGLNGFVVSKCKMEEGCLLFLINLYVMFFYCSE